MAKNTSILRRRYGFNDHLYQGQIELGLGHMFDLFEYRRLLSLVSGSCNLREADHAFEKREHLRLQK
jgi:hypothetical protein